MTKITYYYNKETCSYEPIETPLRTKLFKGFLYLFTAGVMATVALFGYYNQNTTPKEEVLISERENLDIQWGILKHELKFINNALAGLQKDDHEFREILELNDLPEEIRSAGIGGDNQLSTIRSQNLKFEKQIVEAYQKIAKLKAQLSIEGLSLDTIAKYASERETFWQHIPAIQPVDHEDLRRFSPVYGMRMNPVLGKWMPHRGLDFMGAKGIPIYASGDGVIEMAQMTYGGFGNFIIINHGYGYKSRYAHLHSLNPFTVKRGDNVKRGQIIGYMGSTGRSAGVHLHYEVTKDNVHVNPMGFFQLELEEQAYKKLILLAKDNVAPLD